MVSSGSRATVLDRSSYICGAPPHRRDFLVRLRALDYLGPFAILWELLLLMLLRRHQRVFLLIEAILQP